MDTMNGAEEDIEDDGKEIKGGDDTIGFKNETVSWE